MLTNNKLLKSKRGFSIIELVIALALGCILFIGLMAIFVANINHYQKTSGINELDQQLNAILSVMANDIRRAGYWANAANDIGTNQNNNPFMTSSYDITVNGSGNCILFSYDKDANGSLASISTSIDDEHYGFRLQNNTIQSRPPGGTYSCTATNWETITDSNVLTITALSFTLNTSTVTTGPSTRGLTMRSVDISITGQLANDSSVSETLTQHVRIRNDKFNP